MCNVPVWARESLPPCPFTTPSAIAGLDLRQVRVTAPNETKTVALVLSTMRSGSTLLKALLAAAPDVSDLPETDFQRYVDPRTHASLFALSPEPVLLLKRPGWFNEIGTYPRLPKLAGVKKVVLVRDVYANVLSLRRMTFRHLPFLIRSGFGNRFFCERYWHGTYQRLRQLVLDDPENTVMLRYEDLLADPLAITARLFAFIGSAQTSGVDTYQKPADYHWRWGKDDGGDNIKSLQVQPPKPARYDDQRLYGVIKRSAAVRQLRLDLGYADLP